MMRLLTLSLLATAGLSVAATAAPVHERLRGIVSAVSANGLTVHTETGDVALSLHGTAYLTTTKTDLNNIATNNYIGVATKDIGGEHVALDVIIFPPALEGAAEGHFGWDRLPDTTLAGGASTASSMTNGSVAVARGASAATTNSSMTNGSVSTASESNGVRQLTVTYKGGEQTILVPPTAPIVMMKFGAVSDIKPGDGIFVNAVADGGATIAGLIIIGMPGAVPPI
jgi:glutamine phosphoribosylpyrophosphate amidotransferase